MDRTFQFNRERGREVPIFSTDAAGDPYAKARIEASNTRERIGSTGFQRAGLDPNYRPGYGASAPANIRESRLPTTEWDRAFPAASITDQPTQGIHVDPFGPHPMNNLMPGQANTASLAQHVHVTPTLPINPRATGNETGDQWAAIQRGNAAAYAPGGTFHADPYQTTPAVDLASIAARYGTPGGQNGVAFVHDARSNVDTAGNQLAAPQPVPIAGVSPASAHNDDLTAAQASASIAAARTQAAN